MRGIVLTLIVLSTPVRADPPSPSRDDVARQHYRRGQARFSARDYPVAVEEFEAGYQLSPQPLFLFNIALSYRLWGKLDLALDYYRRFLAVDPRAPERAEVEARIADLERALKLRAEPASSPQPIPSTAPAAAASPPPRSPRALVKAGIAVGVIGAVGVILGATFTGLAARADDQLDHPTQGAMFDPGLERQRGQYSAAGISLLIAGGALAGTGIALGIVGARRERREARR